MSPLFTVLAVIFIGWFFVMLGFTVLVANHLISEWLRGWEQRHRPPAQVIPIQDLRNRSRWG